MAYMIGITIPEGNEKTNELRIEIGDQIHVTSGNIFDAHYQVYMTFDKDDFKEFLEQALELIDLLEQKDNGTT